MIARWLSIGPLLALLAVLLAPAAVSAEARDPAATLTAFAAALNAHDVGAASGVFAADATLVGPGKGFQPTTFSGRAAIEAFLNKPLAAIDNPTTFLQIGTPQVNGDSVTASFLLVASDLAAQGLQPMRGTFSGTAQGGVFTSMTVTLSPDWVAQALAVRAHPGVQVPAVQVPAGS